MQQLKKVDIIIPVHNEESNIGKLIALTKEVLQHTDYEVSFIVVDDGSTDNTLAVLKGISTLQTDVKFISFSKNFGHQIALKAGLDHSFGDCAISMDGDMQHPPEVIPKLLQEWEAGFDIVYTIRQDEASKALMKKTSSRFFYTVLNSIADLNMEKGAADFRLLDKKVVAVLKTMNEYEPFFRGLVNWIGFKQTGVEYLPQNRASGVSKYTFRKMLRFAMQGITSFSIRPLYAAAYLGFTFSLLSLLYIPYALISFLMGHPHNGWASLIVTVAFFGGLQLTILGVMGLYLGKLFMQAKQRPLYIIKETSP